ncbi:ATP-grasp domain-containing protein [Flavobacterium artemisiae]|uniref:ATP-grasp domain-containing protein n=1 Tax=Flavobacterium artemisiae TaxID=2126556 RepID=A0ABW4H8A3_9FLAO
MEKKVVLVTGTGGNVGQGVLRNIKSLGYNITVIGTDIEAFTAGNHLCDVTYRVPYSYSENYISTINSIVEKEKVDLIIPTTDYEVYYLAVNQNQIVAKIAVSKSEKAKIYLDKYLTYLHHQTLNIPFSKSWLPSEFNDETKDFIVKPREGRGSRGIYINPADPKSFSDEFVIQPLHKGIEITTAFYVTKQDKLHGLFTMERELSNGATSKSKTTKLYDKQLEEIIKKMIQSEGLYGSINLQSIVSSNGEIFPFEVNCRISGTNSIRHNLGFQDVKYTLQEYLFDEKPDEVNPIEGVAVRLLYDVIYPYAVNESELNNNKSQHIIY